ncbi:MAG: hypothetical protein HeimC3_26410 [Candidatus Heimdallarchaeota archaeon LC_3]|nr:MAG: hypothetical protein HeimC3_26410 [Candidatus Heimdallarchaeota archaeon LC_3]
MNILDFITIFAFITGGSILGVIKWFIKRRNRKYHGPIKNMMKIFNKQEIYKIEELNLNNFSPYIHNLERKFEIYKKGIHKAIPFAYIDCIDGKEEKYIEFGACNGFSLSIKDSAIIEEFVQSLLKFHFLKKGYQKTTIKKLTLVI